jgi:ABC-2 type transport system permease protein
MLATGIVRQTANASTPQELQTLLNRGRVKIGIVIPADFERRKLDGREAVQVIVDGSDTSVQATARQLAAMPLDSSSGSASSKSGFASISVLALYNPERRAAVNVVPGLIGVILTMTMIMFTAMAIVRERERGNLELLISTPVSSAELMIGKVLPYIGVGLVQTTVVLTLGMTVFDVPVRGHLIDVYGAAMLLIMANLTLGLLVSTRAQTQFQAMQMAFFLFLPSILLSGFMFPFDGMPVAAQRIAEALPLTHFVRLIRGVMLRGANLFDLWPDVLALLAFTAIMMTLAISRFRKRLD